MTADDSMGPDRADGNWWADVALPGLLSTARTTYGRAIRAALGEVDCADMPARGSFVVGGLARTGAPLSEVVSWMGASKQATSQLVDTLVLRGYLERSVDPEDRRRMRVALTERGELAASVSRAAVDRVDAALAERVGASAVAATRATLAALVELGNESAAGGAAPPA